MEVSQGDRLSGYSVLRERSDTLRSSIGKQLKRIGWCTGAFAIVALIASIMWGERPIDPSVFSGLERREKLAGLEELELESRGCLGVLVYAMNDADEEVRLAAYRKLSHFQNRWSVETERVRNRYQRELKSHLSGVLSQMDPTQRVWANTLVRDGITDSSKGGLSIEGVPPEAEAIGDHSQPQFPVALSQPSITSDLAAQPIPASFSVSLASGNAKWIDSDTKCEEDTIATAQIDNESHVGLSALPFGKAPELKSVEDERVIAGSLIGIESPKPWRSYQGDRSEDGMTTGAFVDAGESKGGVVLAGAMVSIDTGNDDVDAIGGDQRLQDSVERTSLASFDEATVVQWLASDHVGFQQLARKELRCRGYDQVEVMSAEQYVLGSLDERLSTVQWVATSADASLELWLPLFFRSNSREFKLAAVSILSEVGRGEVTGWLSRHADIEPDAIVAERIKRSVSFEVSHEMGR